MSILPTGAIPGTPSRPAQVRKGAGSGFKLPGADAAVAAHSPLSIAGVDPFLFLQEVEAPAERDARAKQHGFAMLDALSNLQRNLLEPEPNADPIASLKSLVIGMPMAATPALRDAIDAIALRVHVELARAERDRAKTTKT
jgi:hypothetical protein